VADKQEKQENVDEKEELIIVEEDPAKKLAETIDKQDEKDDEPEGDEPEGKHPTEYEGDEDEREAIRERRRKEKQERKERREKAINRDKLELDFLRKRNDDLERRVTAQEQHTFSLGLSQIDAKIAKASNEIQMAEKVIAKAIEAGNGADVTQAMRYRDQAMQEAYALNQQKLAASQRQNTAAQPQIDSDTLKHAQQFMAENKWYDPSGKGEDSSIVMAIDQTLAQEGFDPRSADYWDELRERAARRLPERFKRSKEPAERGDSSERTPRGGPAVGSSREHAPASTRKEIYISPERKQALVDAGVWDDPVLRMKYVKRYAEYDRMNKA